MLINTARLVPNLAKQMKEPLTKHDALTVLISCLKWKEHEFGPQNTVNLTYENIII